MIGTSICIGKEHKEKLTTAAARMEITVNQLLVLLLQRSRTLFGQEAVVFQTVKYQCFGNEGYNVMHIEIPEIEYEYAVAQRYIFKISVSYVVRLCIEFLLSDIIDEYAIYLDKQSPETYYVSTNFFSASCLRREYSIPHLSSSAYEYWIMKWTAQKGHGAEKTQ